MCSMSVLCPLCAQSSFNSIDALRNSLVKVANGPLPCPICNQHFLGLDKLTIHLFSHTSLMTNSIANAATTSIEKTQVADETKSMSKTSKSPTQIQATTTNEMIGMKGKQNKKPKEKKNDLSNAIIANSQQQLLTDSPNQQHQNSPSNEVAQLSSCDICEFTFRNEQLRDMHFNLVHQNSTHSIKQQQQALINQPDSPTSTSQSTTLEHDFKCHLCSKTYKTKGSLRVHLKVVHMVGLANVNNPTTTTKINICDRIRHKETKAQKFNLAIQQYKKPVASLQPTIVPCTTQNSPQMQDLLLLKPMQEIKTENIVSMPTNDLAGNVLKIYDPTLLNSNHLLAYTSLPASQLCKDTLSKPSVENPKIWECDVCSKSFTTKYFLKKHKRLHTGEMPYTCEICARTFTFQQSYHKHLLYHSDEKNHICATCGRAFKEVSTLHNHERIHSGEKPFKCEICGKCFRQRVSFLVHTRIHTGVMPYKCEQCDKNFRYKVSLRTHKCLASKDVSQEVPENPNQQPNSPQLQQNTIKEEISNEQVVAQIYGNQNSPASLEIAAINQQALLSKTIDDIVVESCKKLGIGNDGNNDALNANLALDTSPQVRLAPSRASLNGFNEGSSSPLQKLQEMRLYSPKFDGIETTTAINDNTGDFSQMFFK